MLFLDYYVTFEFLDNLKYMINYLYIPSKKHHLADIKIWFHKIGNKNNEVLFAPPSQAYPGYMLDSNILAYLEELLNGKIPIIFTIIKTVFSYFKARQCGKK
jgi:hypothetical protein